MKKVTPFSNGNEAMSWLDQNCDICRRSNCGAKVALQRGFISGYITERTAEFIGYDIMSHKMISKCKNFTTIRISPTKKLKKELTPKLF